MKEIRKGSEIENLSGKFVCIMGAKWCGNCAPAKNYLESLEGRYPKCKFYYVDIDKFKIENDAISKKVDAVKSVPTIYVFEGGRKLGKFEGLSSEGKEQLKSLIKKSSR